MILSSFIEFLKLNPYWAYSILFLGSYFETLIGPGFFIYGEIFFLSGSILAGLGYLNIWTVALCCFLGGFLGDSSSYFIGKRYGHLAIRYIFRKDNKYLNYINYKKAEKYFNSHGKKSIFFARFMGPLSWITPFIAGTLKINYKNFLKYNVPGVFCGISIFLIAGYFFGFSYISFLDETQKYIWYVIFAFFIISLYLIERRFNLFRRTYKHVIKKLS